MEWGCRDSALGIVRGIGFGIDGQDGPHPSAQDAQAVVRGPRFPAHHGPARDPEPAPAYDPTPDPGMFAPPMGRFRAGRSARGGKPKGG